MSKREELKSEIEKLHCCEKCERGKSKDYSRCPCDEPPFKVEDILDWHVREMERILDGLIAKADYCYGHIDRKLVEVSDVKEALREVRG